MLIYYQRPLDRFLCTRASGPVLRRYVVLQELNHGYRGLRIAIDWGNFRSDFAGLALNVPTASCFACTEATNTCITSTMN